ncbi:MAG: extracellular solute-binding protein [Hyphomicrobiaceae bacterium]
MSAIPYIIASACSIVGRGNRAGGLRRRAGHLATGLVLLVAATGAGYAGTQHGIAMHGAPALDVGFGHFRSVDPAAPKGGRLTLGVLGGFDTLEPMNVKGVKAEGVRGLVYESLMARAPDEPFTLYGLIAGSVEMPDDRSSITFHLRPEARFSDRRAVTADDVLFTWALLRDKGQPYLRGYYRKVVEAKKLSDHAVRFTFEPGSDREIPLILGLMPILPRHLNSADTFEQTSLVPRVGSGPYVIDRLEAGRLIAYRRDADYWGRDLAVRRGMFNFDEVRFEYFRDQAALFEAFKSGAVDARVEADPVRWVTGYDFPAVREGRVVKREIPLEVPAGMSGLVMNTRRPPFDDPEVRRALIEAFDFEWINRTLYNGRYARTESYFARSSLASAGRPADDQERQLLAPFVGAVRRGVMDGTARLPVSDGSGNDRRLLRRAFERLKARGWRVEGRRLVSRDGRPLAFEMLARTREQERLMLAFAGTLGRIGIAATIRQVDDSQYWRRLKSFDFDMVQWTWPASLSPGNEQVHRFSSRYADVEGALNLAGVRSQAADAMIEAMLAAKDRAAFVAAVRAFDRVLLSGDYVVPLFHAESTWLAHWRRIEGPARSPLLGLTFDSWWANDTK